MNIFTIIGLLFALLVSVYPAKASIPSECQTLYRENKLADAVTICMQAAEDGDASTQVIVGKLYLAGAIKIKSPDPKLIATFQALFWFLAAANQNNAEAQYLAGSILENPKVAGLKGSIKDALPWYFKAADQGYKDAQAILDNPDMLIPVGNMYQHGDGVKKNVLKALNLYWKSYLQGNKKALTQFKLALSDSKNQTMALALYWEAITHGDKNVGSDFIDLAMKMRYDDNLKYDLFQALPRFWDMAINGDEYTKYEFSFLVFLIAPDEDVSIKGIAPILSLYRTAAEKGNSRARLLSYRGCHKAYDQWSFVAKIALGQKFCFRHGVQKDLGKVLSWFRKAAKQGNSGAQYSIGMMYKNGLGGLNADPVKAVSWCRKAADQGNSLAQKALGDMYYFGHGVQKDLVKALSWFRKAAKQGNSGAQYRIGTIYQNGLGGLKTDFVKAVFWYQKAAEKGNGYGQYYLGNSYAKGEGVKKNIEIALVWQTKAAKQGVKEAIAWLKIEVEHGNVQAELALGLMYGHGEGVEQDTNTALVLISDAAAHGMKEADTAIRGIIVEPRISRVLRSCLTGVVQLFGTEQTENALLRYGACSRDIMDIDDSLAYLKSGNNLFVWLYGSKSRWILSNSNKNVPDDVVKVRKQNKDYIRQSGVQNDLNSSDYTSIMYVGLLTIANPLAGLGLGNIVAIDMMHQIYQITFNNLNFEKKHPLAVLTRHVVHRQMTHLTQLKQIIKTQQQYIRQLSVNAAQDELQSIITLASVVKKHVNQVKTIYSIFINRDVVLPVLLRTQQLLFIADKESWIGFDHDYMSQAAANFALLNKDMVLTASSSKNHFRKTYSLFKDAAGKAESEDLKVIQNLTQAYSEPNAGSDWWGQ